MLAAPKVPACRSSGSRTGARTCMSSREARHEHGTPRRRWTTTAASSRRSSTTCRTSAPTPRRGPSVRGWRCGDAVPRAVPGAAGHVLDQGDAVEHAGPRRVPRAVAVRVGREGGDARHRGAAHGRRPDRAAPPQPAPRRTRCRSATRTACRTTTWRRRRPSSRRSRSSTTTRSGRSRRRPAGGRPLPRGRDGHLRRADDAARSAYTRPRARRSGSSRRARSTCTWPAARPATASRPPSCSSPPTRSAWTSTTSARSRATPRSRAYGAGTGGSRSGSMLAGAVARDRGDPPRPLVAIAAHRLEAADDDIELADGRASVRGTPAAGRLVRQARGDRLLRAAQAAGGDVGRPRGDGAVHAPGPRCSGSTRPTCAPARSTSTPARSRCSATS